MNIIPLKAPLIKPGQDLVGLFFKLLKKYPLKNEDIIVISSKIVSLAQNRIIDLSQIKVTLKAKRLAEKYSLSPSFAGLIIKEADQIIGGAKQAVLTLKNGIPIANAGIDLSNVKPGFVVLWPQNGEKYLQRLKKVLERRFKAKIGLILADSHCSPLRMGTTGLALAVAGFEGVLDERGKKDLYDRKLLITRRNLADNLASAASTVMGEADERIPLVIIRNAPITLSRRQASSLSKKLLIPKRSCLFRDYKIK